MSGLRARLVVPGRLDVTLTANPGEVVAVIGPNGAGKSTLLAALAGLEPVEGEVVVDGASWTDPSLSVQERRVGLVFQAGLLFPHLSALDNVAFGPRSRGVARVDADAAAISWLERFGIAELAGRRPGELSGGQAQRVAIARALACEPALLLMDEPFSGLDTGVATSLRLELARHLAAYPGVCLLVTHDAIDALTLADRVLVLDEGLVRARSDAAADVAALHELRTDHVAPRYAGSLSGGERRRVHLARGLAVRPDLLLLDEPFSGLDPESHAALAEDSSRRCARRPGRPSWSSTTAPTPGRWPTGRGAARRRRRRRRRPGSLAR